MSDEARATLEEGFLCEAGHVVSGPLPRSQTQQTLTNVGIDFPREVGANDTRSSTFQFAQRFPKEHLG